MLYTLPASCRRGCVTCWPPCAEPARCTETSHETTVQILLNLTEPAAGLACSTLSTDLPTFFVDRFPSVKNDLSHKQKGELANLTRSIHACPENDLHLMLTQQCDEKDDRPLANRLGPSLGVDGPRRGKRS
ncbi:hypothetical protein METHP15_710027 [Pseudomonas sp. P15-2025]